MRKLDAKCENRRAPASTRSVVQLSKLPLATQKAYLYSFTFWDFPHLIRCVLEAGLSADVRCASENSTALHVAAEMGSTNSLRALPEGGANHALVDEGARTPLICATRSGQSACVQLLLDAGANANAADFFANTALMLAAMHKHADCARLLLPRSVRAKHHQSDGKKRTARLRGHCQRGVL
jgi:ankyrin repeat protein